MLKKLFSKISKIIPTINRIIINNINRIRLKNRDFTLISNNCLGAFILHDLNLKFLTPTITVLIYPEDYIRFLENLKFYLGQEIEFISGQDCNYSIGRLYDIELQFWHYKDAESAKEKWEKRSKRVNDKNIFIVMTDRDGCTEDNIRRFNNLPYKNKVIFTNRLYEQFSSAYYIRGFENQSSVGHLNEFQNIFGKRYYDNFDYVKWFNNGVQSLN